MTTTPKTHAKHAGHSPVGFIFVAGLIAAMWNTKASADTYTVCGDNNCCCWDYTDCVARPEHPDPRCRAGHQATNLHSEVSGFWGWLQCIGTGCVTNPTCQPDVAIGSVAEQLNGADDDCDGAIDEGAPLQYGFRVSARNTDALGAATITGTEWNWVPVGAGQDEFFGQFTADPGATIVIHFTGTCSVKSNSTDAYLEFQVQVNNGSATIESMYPGRFDLRALCSADGSGRFSTPILATAVEHYSQRENLFGDFEFSSTNQYAARARLVGATSSDDEAKLENYAFVIERKGRSSAGFPTTTAVNNNVFALIFGNQQDWPPPVWPIEVKADAWTPIPFISTALGSSSVQQFSVPIANHTTKLLADFSGACSIQSDNANAYVDLEIYASDGATTQIFNPARFGATALCSRSFGTLASTTQYLAYPDTFDAPSREVYARARLVGATSSDDVAFLYNYAFVVEQRLAGDAYNLQTTVVNNDVFSSEPSSPEDPPRVWPMAFTGPSWTFLPMVISLDGAGQLSSSDGFRFSATPETPVFVEFSGTCEIASTDRTAVVDFEILVADARGVMEPMYPFRFGITPICVSDGSGTFSKAVSVSTFGHYGDSEAFFSGPDNFLLARARVVSSDPDATARLTNYAFVVKNQSPWSP